MRLERIQEDDMRKAMAKVRAVLGKDAVLISSRSVDNKVEVIAASDYDPDKLAAELLKLNTKKTPVVEETPQIEHVWEVLGDIEDAEPLMEEAPSLLNLNAELGRLRKLFEGELAHLSWQEESIREPNRHALMSRLEAGGIDREIANRIVTRALPCKDLDLGWLRIQKILSLIIKKTDEDLLETGGIIALLGSTGVGKTATAAKIAAQFALRHGRNQVALITTDQNRVGGQTKLVSLGSSLGIPVQVVANHAEVRIALESFAVRKLVIIDTEGVSPRELASIARIAKLTAANREIQPYLVLAASTQEAVINETLDAYACIPLAGAIVTKVDETNSLGAVVSGLIRSKLPVTFISNGQNIPEDLHAASIDYFVNKITEAHANAKTIVPKQRHFEKVVKMEQVVNA